MVNVQMCLCWVVGDGQCSDVFVLVNVQMCWVVGDGQCTDAVRAGRSNPV